MTVLHHLYAIRLPVNDYAVAYVGVTKNTRGRWCDHRSGSMSAISKAIWLCGKENCVFQVLESGGRAHIYQREIETIAALNTRWSNGYNLGAGGFGGRDPLPSTLKKQSDAKRGNTYCLGRTHSAEARKKQSDAKRGKLQSAEHIKNKADAQRGTKRSAETRQKMSAILRGNTRTRGKPKSAEHIKKQADAQRGKTISAEHRQKISASLRGNVPWNKGARGEQRGHKYNLGKIHSAETRKKMSDAKRGRPWPPARRAAYEAMFL